MRSVPQGGAIETRFYSLRVRESQVRGGIFLFSPEDDEWRIVLPCPSKAASGPPREFFGDCIFLFRHRMRKQSGEERESFSPFLPFFAKVLSCLVQKGEKDGCLCLQNASSSSSCPYLRCLAKGESEIREGEEEGRRVAIFAL